MPTLPLISYLPAWKTHLLSRGLSPTRTILVYERLLTLYALPTIGDLKPKKLSRSHIDRILLSARSHGPSTPFVVSVALRSFLRFLIDSQIPLTLPLDRIKSKYRPQKEIRFITPSQLASLRSSPHASPLLRALLELLASSGLRIGEALALRRDDVLFTENELRIRNIKNGECERAYINAETKTALLAMLSARADDHPALFYSQKTRASWGYAGAYAALRTLAQSANVPCTPHTFRRTFATTLLRKGANIKEVQFLCRHKSERTTLRHYTGVLKEEAKKTHQRIFATTAP